MDLKDKKVVFVLTYIEAKEWNKFYPAWMFGQVYDDYQFIVLDNGNQPLMEEWCNLTGSLYYGAEHNIGSSGGYNWIFRVANLLKLERAVLLQADVEIISKECLDVLFDTKWNDNDIPFWPQEPRKMWDTQPDNLGGTFNLGQFFSFCPYYMLNNNLLVDENYVVTHFDDADLMRRMLMAGTKTHNQLLNYEHIDIVPGPDEISSYVAGLYNMHHFSSLQSGSGNHEKWQDYNQSYYDKKWFNKNGDKITEAYDYPFGQCNIGTTLSNEDYIKLDIHKSEPHSDKWLPLGYPPYPIEYEVNRFWEQLTKNST